MEALEGVDDAIPEELLDKLDQPPKAKVRSNCNSAQGSSLGSDISYLRPLGVRGHIDDEPDFPNAELVQVAQLGQFMQ